MKPARERARAGVTMVEVAMAGAILAMLWLGLADAMRSGMRSQEVLTEQADRIEDFRRAGDLLRSDLSGTSAARMSVTLLEDGRYVLELQHPIRVEGVDAWGVRTPGTPADADTNGEPGWHIRYVAEGGGPGAVVPLVRRVVDDAEEVRDEEVVAGLSRDGSGTPGFRVDSEGAMVAVYISRAGHGTGSNSQETSFHVRIRN